jgi:hypothetical protein
VDYTKTVVNKLCQVLFVKNENKKYHTVGTVLNSNRKVVEKAVSILPFVRTVWYVLFYFAIEL